MLKEIYEGRKDIIDDIIKNATKEVEGSLYEIDYESNKEIVDKLEENYSIKLANICEKIYIQGLKDGINLIKECKDENIIFDN